MIIFPAGEDEREYGDLNVAVAALQTASEFPQEASRKRGF